MPVTACPFCFTRINSSRLAHQCTGQGPVLCRREKDEARERMTGNLQETYPTFTVGAGRNAALCPVCGGPARQHACPVCHTALPADFADSKALTIGIVGASGSGKTVLVTTLVKHLRDVTGLRFGADVRFATDNPGGARGLGDYQANREAALYHHRKLPASTSLPETGAVAWPAAIVLRWRQESARRFSRRPMRTTILQFVDISGGGSRAEFAMLGNVVFACDALIVTLDPFSFPGARPWLPRPHVTTQASEHALHAVLSNLTELLRAGGHDKYRHRITTPVAVVLTKMDACYPALESWNPITAASTGIPAYDRAAGLDIHEYVRALLDGWDGRGIDLHMQVNYSDFRYFAVSSLGAEPDYENEEVAPGGVRPHRIEDPVLWLLSKTGTIPFR